MENILTKTDFNDEPVTYCSHCLSLAIRTVDDTDFCDRCGGTEVQTAHIHEWETMYEQKYGIKFLNDKKNGRDEKKL